MCFDIPTASLTGCQQFFWDGKSDAVSAGGGECDDSGEYLWGTISPWSIPQMKSEKGKEYPTGLASLTPNDAATAIV